MPAVLDISALHAFHFLLFQFAVPDLAVYRIVTVAHWLQGTLSIHLSIYLCWCSRHFNGLNQAIKPHCSMHHQIVCNFLVQDYYSVFL